ncbi:MAG: hypothetical protein ABSF26_26380 [Thermoguttaceae bacterium]|jgi:hypothetical protein
MDVFIDTNVDFEDAIQYFGAIRKDVACLISRTPHHFPRSTLSVLTPAEFLAAHSLKLKGDRL